MRGIQHSRSLQVLLLLLIVLSFVSTTVLALDWNGSSSGSSGGGTASSGYGVATDGSALVGFRFSLVSEDGTEDYGNSIDVFTQEGYIGLNKFSTKKSKGYWTQYYSSVSTMNTTNSTNNCFAQSSLGFDTPLPIVLNIDDINNLGDMLKEWQKLENNVNVILAKIGDPFVSKVSDLTTERILVEPILRVGLANSTQHAFTVTELAVYGGGYEYNGNWDAGTATYENSSQGSFGFILQYTNRYFPNYMYINKTDCGWDAVTPLTTPASFKNIITQGYGVNILSRETITGEPVKEYTVTYNGNGGVWNNQTTWSETVKYGDMYTTEANFFNRPGYTFVGWKDQKGVDWTSNIDKPWKWSYNYDVTLYAQWEVNTLTVNYYSNYADKSFDGPLNAIGSGNNVIVKTHKFKYDTYYGGGLHNYTLETDGTYLARKGYHGTGYWGTSTTGGTLIHEDTEFASGQALAQKLGKTLETGSVTVNVYPQWEENVLTVNYYSNYADKSFEGPLNAVSSGNNVLVKTHNFRYSVNYGDGLHDYSSASDSTYLGRTGYTGTGYWNTKADGTGKSVKETDAFVSGQALAEALGKDLSYSNATVSVAAQWQENSLKVVYYKNDGTSTIAATREYLYSQNCDNGLLDYSDPSATIYMNRVGYKGTGYWYTNANGSGIGVSEKTGFATGQAMAQKFGLDLTDGSKTINVYARWRANVLTVNYYSNYADKSFDSSLDLSNTVNKKIKTVSLNYEYTGRGTLHPYTYEGAELYLARTGYYAIGEWGTEPEGGKIVTQSAVFSSAKHLAEMFGEDLGAGDVVLNLYPQWYEVTLTINYYSNGADYAWAGTLNPVSLNNNVLVRTVKLKSASVDTPVLAKYKTASDDTHMTKTGCSATGYWGTEPTGGKLVYEGSRYNSVAELAEILGAPLDNGSQTVNLYAAWSAAKLTINYWSNGADVWGDKHLNGESVLLGTQTFSNGDSEVWFYDYGYGKSFYYNLGKIGYTSSGYWSTSPTNGSFVNSSVGRTVDEFRRTYGSSVDLYAQWNVYKYNVEYDPNYDGGEDEVEGETPSSLHTYGVGSCLSENGFTRPGYTFVGWNTKYDGSGTSYADKAFVVNLCGEGYGDLLPHNIVLYAQWEPTVYTIVFDGNGADGGSTESQTFKHGEATGALNSNGYTKSGHTFTTWNTKPDGSGKTYRWYTDISDLDMSLFKDNVLTLYAQWSTVGGYVAGNSSGILGDDSNTGSTPSDPVLTFKQAYTNLKSTGGIIYVVDTVTVSSDMTLASTYYEDANGKVELASGKSVIIKRYSKPDAWESLTGFDVRTFTENMINVAANAKLTLQDITVDGHRDAVTAGDKKIIAPGVEANRAMIKVDGEGTLYVTSVNSKATLCNTYNVSQVGGAIYNYGTVDLTGTLIENNYSEYDGGAIYNSSTGILTSSGSTFKNNVSAPGEDGITYEGGAIYNRNTLVSENDVFVSNNADMGGAISSDGSLTITGSTFTENSANKNGGAVLINKTGTSTITSSVFTENEAQTAGALQNQGDLIIVDCEFTYNTAITDGGAIYNAQGYKDTRGNLYIRGNTLIAHNNATSGAGISNLRGTVNFESGTITDNHATTEDSLSFGGAIYNYGTSIAPGVVNITGGTISHNYATTNGGGVYNNFYSIMNMSGGVISNNESGKDGGGVYIIGDASGNNSHASAYITGGEIIHNNSESSGGGIYNVGILEMSAGVISSNTAEDHGDGVFQAGKFYLNTDGKVDTNNNVYLFKKSVITVNKPLSYTDTAALVRPEYYALGLVCVVTDYTIDSVDAVASDVYEQFDLSPNGSYLLRPGDYLDDSAGIADTDVIISRPYTVSYDANGGKSAPESQTKYWNESIEISSDKPTRDGFVFTSWNSKANGSGTNYEPGDTYSANENVTLYAQWVADTRGITYNGNGATSGDVPVDNNKYSVGDEVTVKDKNTLVKDGYQFAGWNTKADGSGTHYDPNAKFEIEGNTTLYAQWIKTEKVSNVPAEGLKPGDEITYTITVVLPGDANSLTITDTIPEGTTYVDGSVTNNGTFADNELAWMFPNVSAGEQVVVSFKAKVNVVDAGTEITNQASVKVGDNGHEYSYNTNKTTDEVIEYAQITYNGNGSTGGNVPVDNTYYDIGDEATVKDKNTLVKDGYQFAGWNTKADGSGTHYDPNDKFEIKGNTTLYAQWIKTEKVSNAPAEGLKPGDEITYTITVVLPETADTLTITDVIPTGTTYVDASASAGGKYADGKLSWNFTNVAAGAEQVVSFKVKVNVVEAGTEITNQASVKVGDNGHEYDYNTNKTTDEVDEYAKITYNGNGSTGGNVPVDNTYYKIGDETTVKDKNTLVKDGYQFAGWNTKSDGSGTHYDPNDKLEIKGNTTLYAQWIKTEKVSSVPAEGLKPGDEITYTITVVLPEAADTLTITDAIPAGTTYVDGSASTGGKLVNNKLTWSFTNVAAGAEKVVSFKVKVNVVDAGTEITNQASVKVGDNGHEYIYNTNKTTDEVTEYVQITYNGNGSTGGNVPVDNTYYDIGDEATVKDKNTLVKDGYQFAGWNTKADGSGTHYDPNDKFEIEGNTTLYAQWIKTEKVSSVPAEGLKPDSEITYTITVVLPEAADTLTITDVIPTGTTYVDGSASTGGTYADGKLTWNFTNVAAGAEQVVSFKVKVNVVEAGTEITNQASVKVGDNGHEYDYNTNTTKDQVGTTGYAGYIRFISEKYLKTLEGNSKWRFEPLKNLLEGALAKKDNLKDNSEHVWDFSVHDIRNIQKWKDEGEADGKTREQLSSEFASEFAENKVK